MINQFHWQDDGVKAIDPYEDWLFDTGKGYGFPFGPPLETHWHTGTEASADFIPGDKDPNAIYPRLYQPVGSGSGKFQPSFRPFVLRDSPVTHSPVMAGTTTGSTIKRRLSIPLRAASVNVGYSPDLAPENPLIEGSAKVVIGVIDDGIAFVNRRFQSELGKSRVDFAWVQDGDAIAGSDVAFGREYTRGQIESALAEHTDDLGSTDEAALYRALGLTDSRRVMPNTLDNKASHGSHVLDLAAGADYDKHASEVLEEDRIITVQVPAAVTWDTSGIGLDMFILSGVHYILERADRIAPGLPVVINFSYGVFGGPHDGTALLEKAIDEIVAARNERVAPTSVVLPAGNHYLERSHAVVAESDFLKEPVGFCDLPWRVQPNDRTSSYLEIWMPKENYVDGDISVEVIPPGGIASQKLSGVVDTAVVLNHGIQSIARLSYDRHTPLDREDERGRFMLTLAPTEVRNDQDVSIKQLKPALSGLWIVRLIKSSGKASEGKMMPESIHARIQRDTSPFGYPALGRQSYFDEPAYKVYGAMGKLELEDNSSIIKRSGSYNGLATGEVPIVVGGHVESTGKPAIYSGNQSTNVGYPTSSVGPFVSAESDRSPVFRGIQASGVRSGVSVALDGTSVAAPIVTRRVAETLKVGSAKPKIQIFSEAETIEAERQALGYFAERNPTRQGAGRFPQGEIYGS
ncbi:S8 family serine peptidase [Kiloniella antarctica]|uniref:S8 family serine peptidase n=1 Tax=Kiloniella antarctica TaxID=1550907 RepID=A0ABW5BK50_9PROT